MELSANIKKFLARKAEEEKKKAEEERRKKEELLALRSQVSIKNIKSIFPFKLITCNTIYKVLGDRYIASCFEN